MVELIPQFVISHVELVLHPNQLDALLAQKVFILYMIPFKLNVYLIVLEGTANSKLLLSTVRIVARIAQDVLKLFVVLNAFTLDMSLEIKRNVFLKQSVEMGTQLFTQLKGYVKDVGMDARLAMQ